MEKPRASNDVTGDGLQRPSGNHVAYGLDRYSWNQGYNAKYDCQIFENEEPALVARGGVPFAVIPERDRQFKCHRLQVVSRSASRRKEIHYMQEEWKVVPGYDGRYLVSNFGNIRSECGSIHSYKTSKGYMGIRLSKDKVVKNYLVHRLVAMLFVDNPNNYPIINHIDEDKSNSRADNLEWCDYSYNNNYGHRNEIVALKRSRPVIRIDENGNRTFFLGIKAAAKASNCQQGNIWKVVNGKRNTAGGYRWEYASDRL